MRRKKKITREDKELMNHGDHPDYERMDEEVLHMDSHGCNIVQLTCKCKRGHLWGFIFRANSEECYYEDDPMELVPMKRITVESVEYLPTGAYWKI